LGGTAFSDTASSHPANSTAGWGAWLLLAPLILWLGVFVALPAGLLILTSFSKRDFLGRVVYDFTFENYVRAFDPTWLTIFGNSIFYAFLATVICLVVGYPAAYTIGRASPRVRHLLLTLVMVPFWTSFLIRTYAWISILSEQGLANSLLLASRIFTDPLPMMYTPFSIVLGLVYNYLPFMILPIYTSVEKLDNSLIEAAYDLGAGPMRAFSRVIIPLTKPGIAAGALLVFVPAIAMYAITTLMGGGSNPTIGEVIQNQFTKARNQPFGAALGVLLMLLFLVSFLLLGRKKNAAHAA
jgi:spermidine/putrescine transport system permease protein